jgi:thiol-disulfide isomerase/thioredoxin
MSETVRTHLRVRASELVGRNWLNTGGKSLDLEALRGKIVLLDFWTFCCINCLHVLDELRPLEEQYSDVLVTVGVHSPKFEHEADPVALAAAVERYEIHHPVLDDPELETWKAYTARAWPTLVVIDPEGYIVAHLSGEGHADGLAVLIPELIAEHEAKGTLHRGSGPYVAPEPTSGTLRFPGKALFLPAGRGSAPQETSDGGSAAGAAASGSAIQRFSPERRSGTWFLAGHRYRPPPTGGTRHGLPDRPGNLRLRHQGLRGRPRRR